MTEDTFALFQLLSEPFSRPVRVILAAFVALSVCEEDS